MDNTNFNFNFSVSTNVYDRNNDNAAKIIWTETSGTIELLADKITEGFAYCNCFLHKGKNFTNSDKKDDNLKGANLVCLDLDAVMYTYTDFCSLMEQTEIYPNIVYPTANNGKYKPNKREQYNNRYRVIYVVDEPILNKELYAQIHQSIKGEISLLTGDDCIWNDNTDKAVSHFFAGCKNCSITTDKQPYNLGWLMDRYTINTPNIKSATRFNNKGINPPQTCSLRPNNQRNSYTYIQDFFNNKVNGLESATRFNNRERREGIIRPSDTFSEQEKQFIQDYYYLPFSELIHKYIHQYPSIECTPLDYDDTQEIITLPSDYTEIRRKWYKEELTKDNGQTVNLSRVHKTNDGEGRRALLFKNLLLRKRISPTITFCHLLLNAVYEVHYFINNTTDKITKQQIAQIAVNAYFSEDKIKNTTEKRKYKINDKYCAANGVSKRAQSIKVINAKKSEEKNKRMEQIKALYNPNLTDEQNLNILSEKGVIIALRTYKRYKKELGLIKPSKEDKNVPFNIIKEDKNVPLTRPDNSTNLSPQSTPNNKMEETPTNTNLTPREENKGADLEVLERKLKALRTEKDIISFDFNPHYETLKRYDIIKAVVNAEGDKTADKALNLKQKNYTAFILFLQSKLKAKCSEKDVLLKLL